MSNKMFWQIVLLIVIASVVMPITKKLMYKCPMMGKFMKGPRAASMEVQK